ncbi:MAG: acetate--CoA ligase family protein, partial [Streptosporangiaceae bacterium]
DFADIRAEDARALVREFLRQAPDGGWLAPAQAANLLRCYGVQLPTGDDAVTPAGTEVSVRLADDHVFGSLVVFGLADPEAGRAARLTPLTDTDADKLIRSVRLAPLALGRAAAGRGALRDLMLRVSRLAEDLPEVTAVDLDPVIAGPGGATAMSARVELTPHQAQDPFLRKLR